MRFLGLSALTVLLMAGCAPMHKTSFTAKKPEHSGQLAFLDKLKNHLPASFSLEYIEKLIAKNELRQASSYVCSALNRSVDNFALHIVNGFVCEAMLQQRMHDASQDMVMIAYRTAHSLAPTRWLPAYLYGHWELKNARYASAQKILADAVVLRPQHADSCYALACASYYNGDVPVALTAINRALSQAGSNPFIHRAASMIYAAAGQFDKAHDALRNYRMLAKRAENDGDVRLVAHRIVDWQETHRLAKMQKVRIVQSDDDDEDSASDGAKELCKRNSYSINCYVVDVLEDDSASKGADILARPLAITLNGSINSQRARSTINGPWTDNRTFKFGLTGEALKYAVNIANQGRTYISYASRPQVLTVVGEKAFLAESDRITGTPPGCGSINVDAGVKIAVTITNEAPDGRLTIDFEATGSAFNVEPNTSAPLTGQLFKIAKSSGNTTVQAYPGQTIAVMVFNGNTRTDNRRGSPFQRLPIIQYFAGTNTVTSSRRYTLYLLCPTLTSANVRKQKNTIPSQPTPVAHKLHDAGFEVLGNYTTFHYLQKYLSSSPMFFEFRSGDVIPPFWGYADSSVPLRFQEFLSFLYF